MPPTVIMIRHAQAHHNATDKSSMSQEYNLSIDNGIQNWNLPDPGLTDLGFRQARELADHLKDLDLARKIDLIVSSPMRRALQTTETSLGWLMEQGVPAECNGLWQENSSKACDTGTPLHRFQHEFPLFDFSPVYAEWPQKAGTYAFTQDAILARGELCRLWLRQRNEKVIAVVSHSAFLRIGVTLDRFANADYRIYEFSGQGDELVQFQETEKRAGGMGKSSREKHVPSPFDFEEEMEPSPLAVDGEATHELPK